MRNWIRFYSVLIVCVIVVPLEVHSAEYKDIHSYTQYFSSKAHPETGMSLSHYSNKGNDPIRDCGSRTYDMALRSIVEGSNKIVPLYVQSRTLAKNETVLQTMDMKYMPPTGVLNLIRVGCFDEPHWWNNWEFKVLASDNAWIGLAAVYQYKRTKDLKTLSFAEERADFLRALQDQDGGIRMGPKEQYYRSGDKNFYWNHKSTESNLSVLAFLDQLYLINKDPNIRAMADDIYEWVMSQMYSVSDNRVRRGTVFQNQKWTHDPLDYFSPDAVIWMPLTRWLADERLGPSRRERLDRYVSMLKEVKNNVGVVQDDELQGISFSQHSATNKVIAIEWSARLALRYSRVALEYSRVGRFADQAYYQKEYHKLMTVLGHYFKTEGDSRVAPYAVFLNGANAAGMTTDQGWIIPESDASVSNIYYALALVEWDPIL